VSLTDILNQTLDQVAEAKFAGVVGIDGVGVELIFNEADDGIDANLAELELAALAASASGASERVGSGAVRAFTIEAEALTYLAALVSPGYFAVLGIHAENNDASRAALAELVERLRGEL
jgi:predicted regulator of Ras-like GTPase activity (Roadblock/LC7/MglB family)